MGLSRKKGNTNLITLRTELNRLNIDNKPISFKDDTDAIEQPKRSTEGSGLKSTAKVINEAKKRGRRPNAIIDGGRLLTC